MATCKVAKYSGTFGELPLSDSKIILKGCIRYEGCSKSSWPEHEREEIQGSSNVWENYKSI